MLQYAPILDVREYVTRFECEDAPDVEVYLKEVAVAHHLQNTTHTRLFFNDDEELVGYFTVLTDVVQIGKGKRKDRGWQLQEGLNVFPAIKLHYLGVDSRFRSQGYGKQILRYALEHCSRLAQDVGCNFVTAEVKKERITFFMEEGFDYCSRKPASCFTKDGRHVNMALCLRDIWGQQKIAVEEITA